MMTALQHTLLLVLLALTSGAAGFVIFPHTEMCVPLAATPEAQKKAITTEAFDFAVSSFYRHAPEELVVGDVGGCCLGYCLRAERISHFVDASADDKPALLRGDALDQAVGLLRQCVGNAAEAHVAVFGESLLCPIVISPSPPPKETRADALATADPAWEGRITLSFYPDDRRVELQNC
jgi:hypothetical protein